MAKSDFTEKQRLVAENYLVATIQKDFVDKNPLTQGMSDEARKKIAFHLFRDIVVNPIDHPFEYLKNLDDLHTKLGGQADDEPVKTFKRNFHDYWNNSKAELLPAAYSKVRGENKWTDKVSGDAVGKDSGIC